MSVETLFWLEVLTNYVFGFISGLIYAWRPKVLAYILVVGIVIILGAVATGFDLLSVARLTSESPLSLLVYLPKWISVILGGYSGIASYNWIRKERFKK